MTTLVYFVDGPNACGKDYFIDNLISSLIDNPDGDKLSIEVLRATDFFDNKDTASERRKYVRYDTEESKTTSIMIGHLKILERIAELSRQQKDVIIVNRSFLSTLSYNLYKQSQLFDRRFYLDIFVDFMARYLRQNLEVTFVNLLVTDEMLLQRQKQRGEEKPIDPVWNKTLIDNYNRAASDLTTAGLRVVNYQSHSFQLFVDEIVNFKNKEKDDILAKHFLGGGPGG